MSEDCLHLSVWRPAAAASQSGHAVLVWLTGGRGPEEGDGAELAGLGSLVVVKVESRRGALGFLATKDQTIVGQFQPASGTRGPDGVYPPDIRSAGSQGWCVFYFNYSFVQNCN